MHPYNSGFVGAALWAMRKAGKTPVDPPVRVVQVDIRLTPC